ncbi:Kelch repeat-containing protein [Archangium lipolyticum]|uniref:Kelch repeat-containing protein n=1 Tax=Archangium lipolyticum TaxID=2970465 RepID=UPI00214A85C8|nr:kelch repeat-containing protein [Archangium lipolyticum]
MKKTALSLLLLGLLSASQALADTVGNWASNASTATPLRDDFSLTVLDSGEVLASTGGSHWEVYNPYSNTWRTQWLNSPLGAGGYSATLLPSGKVLFAGGVNANPDEYYEDWDYRSYLYDPATGAFTRTGNLNDRRGHHLTVLLDSGKVLALGGYSYYGIPYITNSTELYDPETGTWSSRRDDPQFRQDHTATLLYSGKVLVVGGYFYYGEGAPLTTASLYDPATDTWTATASLPQGRRNHLAVRLYSGQVMVLGGSTGGNTVDVYDPYSEQWSAGPALPIPGPYTTATLLYSGEVLITSEQGQSVLYSPESNSWLATPGMSGPRRHGPKAVRLHTGQVLFLGGTRPGIPYDTFTADVERFTH